jgi:hypothetical protein
MWRFGPHESDRNAGFTSGADGVAHVHLAPPSEGGVMAEVTGPDHLPAQLTLPYEVVNALASAKPFQPYKGPPLSITVDLFAGPRPTAELVLPPGFRGLVKAEIRVNAEGQWPAGQRAFRYTVPADGVVRVVGPAVFGQGIGPDFTARLADGTQLPKDAKAEEVALRWIRRDGNEVYFAVGTSVDETAARRALGATQVDTTPPPKPSSQASTGGGRHGGRGGRR